MHYDCLMLTHNMQLVVKSCINLCGTLTQNAMNVLLMQMRSFVANFAILKHLCAFVANWLMSRFMRFLRKILAPETEKIWQISWLLNPKACCCVHTESKQEEKAKVKFFSLAMFMALTWTSMSDERREVKIQEYLEAASGKPESRSTRT